MTSSRGPDMGAPQPTDTCPPTPLHRRVAEEEIEERLVAHRAKLLEKMAADAAAAKRSAQCVGSVL